MGVHLIETLSTTEALAGVFSDESILRAMLDFEAALAQSEARVGVIPASAAKAISDAARKEAFNVEEISRDGFRAGTFSIPLVKALTERVRAADPDSARYVHWGATSQDVGDSAMVLLLKRACEIIEADHLRLRSALRNASNKYAGVVMSGRTLLQPAPPVTFGLKAAGWYGALCRSWAHLKSAAEAVAVLQFGGASGTLAALEGNGAAVSAALAEALNLRNPAAPWHSHRDRIATFICACGVYTGCLGKFARDMTLLMQAEVGEAFEPGGAGRGSSSAMPHKHNPVACSLALAAAFRVPGLVASFLAGMPHEHERGTGGWQAEWTTVVNVVGATGLAAASMAEVAEGLSVNAERMRANIDLTLGTIFSERAMLLLSRKLDRDVARHLVEEAGRIALKTQRRFVEVLAEMPEARGALTDEQLRTLDVPEEYLGSAEIFRKQLLAS